MAGKAAALEVVHPDCAGIDVGKRKHYVAVDGSRFERPVRHFGTFTEDLEAIARWLSECGVRQVAMESTGVYWIPLFEVLDRAGFEVHLVNPRATKQVSGRKSDVLDCQWIRQLMSYGLLRGAFRAADAVCPMRAYARLREQLVRDRSRAVQHMQKALTQMNVQLDNVLSDIMGKTGQLIVRAIVAGERDGAALARFRDRRCKADEATIAASLRGNWRAEHLFALTQALARHDMLQAQIEACAARIDAELERHAADAAAPASRSREGALRATLDHGFGRRRRAVEETHATGHGEDAQDQAETCEHEGHLPVEAFHIRREDFDLGVDGLKLGTDLLDVRAEVVSDLLDVLAEIVADSLDVRAEVSTDLLDLRAEVAADLVDVPPEVATDLPEAGLHIVLYGHVCPEFLAKRAGDAFGLFAFHAGLAQRVAELQRVDHGLAHVGSLLQE